MTAVLVCAPLAVEAFALRRGHPGMHVVQTGMGEARSRRAVASLASDPARALVVAGFGGAVDPALEPGDVVVADAVSGPDESAPCDAAHVTTLLRDEGLHVVVGPIACRDHVVTGAERRALHEDGARAVDMESVWLAAAARGRPFAVVRAVVDTPRRELSNVFSLVGGGARGYRALCRVGRALASWR